jgi:hypothetical protein
MQLLLDNFTTEFETAYLGEHQPNWNKAFLQLSHILLRCTIMLISQPIIVVVIRLKVRLKVLVNIKSLLRIVSKFGRVPEFEFLGEGGKRFCGIVGFLFFTISSLLSGFKLVEYTFGDKVEDMGEATGLVGSTGEVLDEGRQMLDHRVIVGGIIAGDAKDLECRGKFLWLFDHTKD